MKPRRTAAEILTTGYCNLNCKYCYIPKTEMMEALHEDIKANLHYNLPENTEYLAFWGTEPTLTLNDIPIEEISSGLPNLKQISFSTNLMTNPKIILSFVEKLDGLDRDLTLEIQISHDGIFTNENRHQGAETKIKENYEEIKSTISPENIEVDFRWKPTVTIDNIEAMIDEPKLIDDYFESVKHPPTLVVPGKYTSSDGEVLAVFFRLLREKNYPNTYSTRLCRIIRFFDELEAKPEMFTCSGGDSEVGIDHEGNTHICHRTFYLNNREYIESIGEEHNYDNWDVSLLSEGKIDMINRYFIVSGDSARFTYVMRNYHDSWKLRLSYTSNMIRELALVDQADREYLHNEGLRELLSTFINTCLSCPMENLLNTGIVHFTPLSLLRMFGNGAFQEILKTEEVKKTIASNVRCSP